MEDLQEFLYLNLSKIHLQPKACSFLLQKIRTAIHSPTTTGKVERFFRTYKEEYAVGTFSSLADYIRHYNEERLHMSLHYKTPKQTWDECKLVS